MKLAISGASGKTGFRIAEEAKKSGFDIRLLIRQSSKLPSKIASSEQQIISLSNIKAAALS